MRGKINKTGIHIIFEKNQSYEDWNQKSVYSSWQWNMSLDKTRVNSDDKETIKMWYLPWICFYEWIIG